MFVVRGTSGSKETVRGDVDRDVDKDKDTVEEPVEKEKDIDKERVTEPDPVAEGVAIVVGVTMGWCVNVVRDLLCDADKVRVRSNDAEKDIDPEGDNIDADTADDSDTLKGWDKGTVALRDALVEGLEEPDALKDLEALVSVENDTDTLAAIDWLSESDIE